MKVSKGVSLKALTFRIRFFTAQFKDHLSKLVRRTYFIPPPSAVAGIFGAILGLSRRDLMSQEIMAGAELRSIQGKIVNIARLLKFKGFQPIPTVKESEELYMPEYKFAIASAQESLIYEGFKRLKDLDFEYDIFGGNDYHFVDFIGEPKLADVLKSREGYGYCPQEDFERIEVEQKVAGMNPTIFPVTFLANVNSRFVQVCGAKIIAKRELDAVKDDESIIFVHKVKPFFVTQIGDKYER